ncbi:MAG: hypothetical protein IJG45_00780 [Oscillospiraceae bacterium]|nr:hypothetical protein [Oscillospiraceae bacterium]
MKFEKPEVTVTALVLRDVLTASGKDWDLPVVTEADAPQPSGWETPIYP